MDSGARAPHTWNDGEKVQHNQQNCPTGKSLPIIGISVKSQNKKYFAFPEGRNSGISVAIPSRYEGRFAIVISAGRGAVDVEVPTTNGIEAYGEVVWS
jgi:hypothetical protein